MLNFQQSFQTKPSSNGIKYIICTMHGKSFIEKVFCGLLNITRKHQGIKMVKTL